ncbi:MAG: isovaleryl-CoA dehydrogenase [Bacteroidota bacterium]
MKTHDVFNQVPPLENHHLFETDIPLQEAVEKNQGNWALSQLESYGHQLGTQVWIDKGFQANQSPPVFHSHDRVGNRIDEVEFHPAYHELMTAGIGHQIHAFPWNHPRPGAHTVRMALFYLHSQNEAGSCCPLSMTFACVPTLQQAPSLARSWLPKILSEQYDPRSLPVSQKKGATIGMAMTEKQGGTDVRANSTQANQAGSDYELSGHKWFCSAPMSDAFLTLAQSQEGLSCFLVPRWRPDGSRNGFHIQRLKNKLGNRSNASSEVEFHQAFAQLVGEAGKGISTIIEMVSLTRYDCMIGSTALMRRAVAEVVQHIRHRKVMGKYLIDHPLMQNVVADMCLEVEAALCMTARVAKALDHTQHPEERLLLRLLLPIGKYWICKRGVHMMGEAMECLGGNGYVEASILPRLYREIPVNSIWEGSGNVQCLDVLRAISRNPESLEVLHLTLAKNRHLNKDYDQFLDKLWPILQIEHLTPYAARQLTEFLAKALQASFLLESGNPQIAEAYCTSRLTQSSLSCFGTLPAGIQTKAIIERALPHLD